MEWRLTLTGTLRSWWCLKTRIEVAGFLAVLPRMTAMPWSSLGLRERGADMCFPYVGSTDSRSRAVTPYRYFNTFELNSVVAVEQLIKVLYAYVSSYTKRYQPLLWSVPWCLLVQSVFCSIARRAHMSRDDSLLLWSASRPESYSGFRELGSQIACNCLLADRLVSRIIWSIDHGILAFQVETVRVSLEWQSAMTTTCTFH